MARQVSVSVENNFKGGLITEATGLNFPENACTETYNCIHDEKGRTRRRLGFDYENGYEKLSADITDASIAGYTWYNVTGDGSLSFRVQQIGATLYFYNILTTGDALSPGLLTGSNSTVDLTDFAATPSVGPQLNECAFSSGNGYLIVVHPQCYPFYVTYDTTNGIVATQINVQIRDFEGLDDTLDVDERPTANISDLTKEHKYNLFNQGWYWDSNDALTDWESARSDMPSNSDVWWLYKSGLDGSFDTALIDDVFTGNAPAPKGHYVLDLFDQDRSTASGVSSITTVSTGNSRFTTVAFMNNRAFYGGLNSQGHSSKIYASRIVEEPTDFGQCFQDNDPTAEDLSDILPSDGAVIPILGMEACCKIWPLHNYLFVFGTNGIWAISGSQGIGFTATDYTVTKISSVGAISGKNFVDMDGFPVWWNVDGIYMLQPSGDGSGGFIVVPMTDKTIRTFFLDIPTLSKYHARGAFNPVEKIVQWVYRNEEPEGIDDRYQFDRTLRYSAITGAFYPWTIGTDTLSLHDVFVVKGEAGLSEYESVTTTEGFEIEDFTGEIIETLNTSVQVITPIFKYVTSVVNGANSDFTFAEVRRTEYLDWVTESVTGEDYDSYFITGYKIHAQAQRFFQTNYIHVFLEQETDASCFLQGLWEWTTSSDSNRWSTAQQIYNSNLLNRAINHRRLKIRGKGHALQLKFYSETGKPFTIVGWSAFETQNAGI